MNYQTAVIQLPLVKETKKEPVRSPGDVARLCSDLRDLAQESFHVLALNTKHILINRYLVSVGIADASLVHSREVFRQAIIENATAIIVTHNHPSGDSTPSAEDVRITKALISAGAILDIKVADHVIIGRPTETTPGFLSMRETGLCDFG